MSADERANLTAETRKSGSTESTVLISAVQLFRAFAIMPSDSRFVPSERSRERERVDRPFSHGFSGT